MIGNGTIGSGASRAAFEFSVERRIPGTTTGSLAAAVTMSQPGKDGVDTFNATAVTQASFFDLAGVAPGPSSPGVDTVLFTGAGRWNGAGGYTFDVVATDAGEPGVRHDTFSLTVRDGAGRAVAAESGTLDAGNIQALRAR
jgi:hypothetical protein